MVDGNKKDCLIQNNSFIWNPVTQKWDNNKKLNKNSFKSLDAKELLVPRDNQGMLQPFHFLEQTQPSDYGCNFADYQRMVNEYKNR